MTWHVLVTASEWQKHTISRYAFAEQHPRTDAEKAIILKGVGMKSLKINRLSGQLAKLTLRAIREIFSEAKKERKKEKFRKAS